MSKKPFKSQASSSRAVSGAFGPPDAASNLGSNPGNFGAISIFSAIPSSSLSYVYEPPDLNNVSEPNVVVALKNLQKRDSTTKTKALEELQAYVLSLAIESGGVEEAILEAWIKIYPRTSIDSARRVRQLAHLLQGQISISCGKRIAKYMTQAVSAWLAGLYDNDKSVTHAARDSLRQVFVSEAKLKSLWRVYQSSILEFAEYAVTKETIYTLSDERTTSPDDASAKYARVIAAAISMVAKVIEETSPADNEKNEVTIDEFIGKEKVWKYASDPDPYIRLAVYRLATTNVTKSRGSLDMALLSASILTSSLSISQVGSSLKYAETLALLTTKSPNIWTKYYGGLGKKSATRRLCQYLRRGSQGGPPEYWVQIGILIHNLPQSVLLPESDGAIEKSSEQGSQPEFSVLEGLREGVTRKEEPSANQAISWHTYLDACERVEGCVLSNNVRDNLARNAIMPLVSKFVLPSTDDSKWTVFGPHQHDVCVRAFKRVLHISQGLFEEEWLRLSSKIIDDFQTSLPEQAKNHIESQDSISAEIKRWYILQASILRDNKSGFVQSLIARTLDSEISKSTLTLRERKGKPYSAAAILLYATEFLPKLVKMHGETKNTITTFVQEDIPTLLLSPSASQLITILNRLTEVTDVRSIYEASISNLRDAAESLAKSKALRSLVSSSFLAEAPKVEALVTLVKGSLDRAKHGDETQWDLVMAAIGNEDAPHEFTDELLANMANGLSIEDEKSACLEGLEMAVKRNGQALKSFTKSPGGSILLSKLLFLTESSDVTVSQKSQNLSIAIEAILADGKGSGHAIKPIIEIINHGIDTAGQDSLSINALVEQAQKLLHQAPQRDVQALAAEILPNFTQWTTALKPFVTQLPNPSTSIMKPLGGAVNLIDRTLSEVADLRSIARDLDGYSPAMRMAWYVTKLLGSTNILDHTTEDQKAVIFQNLALFAQLASHNISVPESVLLWDYRDSDLESEIASFSTDVQTLLLRWTRDFEFVDRGFIYTVRKKLLDESRGISAASYYSGCACTFIGAELVELYGYSTSEEDSKQLGTMWGSPDIFTKIALLESVSDNKLLSRFCNKLLDDLTGYDLHKEANGGLRHLVFLNCIVETHEDLITKIPPQRLIYFIKHLIPHFQHDRPLLPIQTEMMKILKAVLAPIKEIYGVFWEELIDIVKASWSIAHIKDDEIPLLHASLRLFEQLKKLKSQESNDDLQDAWKEKQESLDEGLLSLLIHLQDTPDESHEPRKIVNNLLSRLLEGLAYQSTSPAADLCPALASESVALQKSAYGILHQSIPLSQEQISLDKALTKGFVAKLPDELLSLILAAPSLDSFASANFESEIPAILQSYLLSWKLVYDHWINSSSRVKADYAACLKDGTYLPNLLDFTTNMLINKRSKPVNASEFDIESYSPNTPKPPNKEVHWLLIHLYYLSLKHLPNLAKAWWRDTTSRQTVVAVESWTEKYISAQIIASELSAVSEWASSQSTSDQPLTVRVSPSTREITASMPIDEQYMQIVIRLPLSYPLSRATVDSVHRVAVDEKKWRSWLMTTQGVINISGSGDEGALIDGLMAWRRNVTATLKGQTECAICYSVVGADRQLPGKRCGTCRNMFHGSCLFRWFKSSNSSSCPLCRNSFNYG